MKHESPKERAERKALWMARATSHMDTPQIRKEAAAMFEKVNTPCDQENCNICQCNNYK